MLPIKYYEQKVLIYLYRPSYLKRDFSNRDTVSLLGIMDMMQEAERCLVRLMERLRENREFPHEIGLFLGYPPEDVRGFIENRAETAKCTGYWKVYGDEEEVKRLFGKYKKCTDIYYSNWVREREWSGACSSCLEGGDFQEFIPVGSESDDCLQRGNLVYRKPAIER